MHVCDCVWGRTRCTHPEPEAVPGSPHSFSTSLLPSSSCTCPSPACPPPHLSQLPLAAHHLPHEPLWPRKGAPSVLHSPLRAEASNWTRGRESVPRLSHRPRAHSWRPAPHCLTCTASRQCCRGGPLFSQVTSYRVWARPLSRGY